MGGVLWVSGASGFVGRFLVREALAADWQCVSLGRGAPPRGASAHLPLDLERFEVGDPGTAPVPTACVHLAAIAQPAVCEADPERAMRINGHGTDLLLDLVARANPEARTLVASTGAVYAHTEGPFDEEDPVEARGAYVQSKLMAEQFATSRRAAGQAVSVVRAFNHTGAGQAPGFVLPSFALRLAEIEVGAREPHLVSRGKLDAVRDFLHVRQVVACYLELIESVDVFQTVNVCSGEGQVIRELLDRLLARSERAVELIEEEAPERGEGDADSRVGSVARLEDLLSGRPRLDVEDLLDEMMADARARVRSGERVPG